MCCPFPNKVKSTGHTILNGEVLAQINSCVETDAGLNRDYQKLLPVTFDFALDLGFNILPEHLSLFPVPPPSPPPRFQSSCIQMISSKGFTGIMAEKKISQIKIVNDHFASQSGFVVNNSHVVITLYILVFPVCMEGALFSHLMTLELPAPSF